MAYIEGEGRKQGTLFPVVLDDLISSDHICRVIDAFVEKLAMSELGFEHAQAAETEIGIAINRGNRTAIIDNFVSYSLGRPKQAGKWASAKGR